MVTFRIKDFNSFPQDVDAPSVLPSIANYIEAFIPLRSRYASRLIPNSLSWRGHVSPVFAPFSAFRYCGKDRQSA